MPSSPLRLAGILSALAALVASVNAQSPLPSAAPNSNEETLQLDPFVVDTSADHGYTAVNQLVGGRTQLELKDNPSQVAVFTQQFLSDIDSTNFRSAAFWAPDFTPAPEVNTNGFGGFTVNLRNQGASFEARNGFLAYIESDRFSVDRYEFDLGPNGTEFGDAGPGGTATTWTKQAFFGKPLHELDLRADSFGGWRATIDVDQALNDRIALRVDALDTNSPTWHDRTNNRRQGIYLAGTVKLTSSDTFRFDGETGKATNAIYPNYYLDQTSYWNGTATYNGVTAPSTTGTGVAKTSSTPYIVYLGGTPNGGLNDLEGTYRTTGTGLAVLPNATSRPGVANFPFLPHASFELQPPDTLGHHHYYTYSFYEDHRFSDNFYVETAYDRQRTIRTANQEQFNTWRTDVNTVLPGGAPNPEFGQIYADAQPTKQLQANMVDDLREMLTWKFKAGSWLEENLNGIAGYRWEDFDSYTLAMRITSNSDQNYADPVNQVMMRRYLDQAGAALGPTPLAVPGVAMDMLPTAVTHQRKDLQYDQVLSATKLFNDRVSIVAGVRRDTATNTQTTTAGLPVDAHGEPILGSVVPPPGGGAPVAVIGKPSWIRDTPVSTNAGAVVWVLPGVGVFGNVGQTFTLPGAGANLISGTAPGVSKSTGYDTGLRVNLLNGRISGSIDYFKSRQTDNLVAGPDVATINQIWNDLGRTDLSNLQYRDTQSQDGEGLEITFTANPTDSIRLLGNVAFPRAWATNLDPGLHAYYAANLATWQAGAASPANPNATQIATDIQTLGNDLLSQTPGTTLNGTYRYTGNIFGEYRFRDGPLKDLTLGGGVNFRGPQKEGVGLTSAYDYLYSPYYYLATAVASYHVRFSSDVGCDFQLNVNNLFNSSRFIYTSFATYRVGGLAANPLIQVPGNTLLPDRREVSLTARLTF